MKYFHTHKSINATRLIDINHFTTKVLCTTRHIIYCGVNVAKLF